MARISLSELRTRASTVDREKVDAITEAEILAQRAADPDAPSEMPADARSVTPPKALRVQLGMTQPEMAAALGIPIGTWRNWEQGRVRLDPTATALQRIVSREPEMALAALAPSDLAAVASTELAKIGRALADADAVGTLSELGVDLAKRPPASRRVRDRAHALAEAALVEAALVGEAKPTRHG